MWSHQVLEQPGRYLGPSLACVCYRVLFLTRACLITPLWSPRKSALMLGPRIKSSPSGTFREAGFFSVDHFRKGCRRPAWEGHHLLLDFPQATRDRDRELLGLKQSNSAGMESDTYSGQSQCTLFLRPTAPRPSSSCRKDWRSVAFPWFPSPRLSENVLVRFEQLSSLSPDKSSRPSDF